MYSTGGGGVGGLGGGGGGHRSLTPCPRENRVSPPPLVQPDTLLIIFRVYCFFHQARDFRNRVLKEILQSLGLVNAGLLLDAKKRVTIQYETLVRPSSIKGKEEKE